MFDFDMDSEATGFEIERVKDVYHLSGPSIDRLVASVNFYTEESLNYFHRTLRKLGVIDALREAGAGEGSTICIDGMEFDFVE